MNDLEALQALAGERGLAKAPHGARARIRVKQPRAICISNGATACCRTSP